jgi:phosphate transport system substrate-binding protein
MMFVSQNLISRPLLRISAPLRKLMLVFALATALAGFSLRPSFAQEGIVLVGSGSSVPAPLYNRWATEYNKRNPAIQFRYLPIGASEGIKQISKGSGDFGAGEVPLTASERAEASLVELPSMMIAIVPYYHLPGAHQELRFTGELLAEIFLGEIKKWNDPQIAKLNSKASLPDLPIKEFYRPAGKGTNYVFSDFLSKTSSKFRTRIGTSPSPKWPVGEPAERSSDMADKVKGEMGSIGYGELQYAIKGDIAYGTVQNPAGNFIKASPETITAACKAVEAPGWDKFAVTLTNASGPESYPLTSFTWLYVRTGVPDARRADALADLLNWIYTEGQQIGGQEGYTELPQQLLAKVKAKASSLR